VDVVEPQQSAQIRQVVVDSTTESMFERRFDTAGELVLAKDAREPRLEAPPAVIISLDDHKGQRRRPHYGHPSEQRSHFHIDGFPRRTDTSVAPAATLDEFERL
jgi:hypothetical protein